MSYVTGKTIKELREKKKLTQRQLAELLMGEVAENSNQSANMKKMQFYICPVCGNIIQAVGKGSYSCCGIMLPLAEIEEENENHQIQVEVIDNDYYVHMEHPMTKEHYISFVAYVTSNHLEMVKLYPEQNVESRFAPRGHGFFYGFCNKHGLFRFIV